VSLNKISKAVYLIFVHACEYDILQSYFAKYPETIIHISTLTWPHSCIRFIADVIENKVITNHSGYVVLYQTPCNNVNNDYVSFGIPDQQQKLLPEALYLSW